MQRLSKSAIVGLVGLVATGALTIAALALVGGRLSEPVSPVSVSPPVLVASPEAHPSDRDASSSPAPSAAETSDDPAGSTKGVSGVVQGSTSSDTSEISSAEPSDGDFDD